jgi:DNA-binding XRE family transcriptional regulator
LRNVFGACYIWRMKQKAPQLLHDWLADQERSASWMARKLDVAPSTVTRWLAGDSIPEIETRHKLAELTGLSVANEEAWL